MIKIIEDWYYKQYSIVKVIIVCLFCLGVLKTFEFAFQIPSAPKIFFGYIVWVAIIRLGKWTKFINYLISTIITIGWFCYSNWLTNNIVATLLILSYFLTIKIETAKKTKIDVKNVVIIGIGMLLYDFISVYLSETMMNVADMVMSSNLPLLIIIPKHLAINSEKFLAIGLGDILIPGIIAQTVMMYYQDKVARSFILLVFISLYVFGLGSAIASRFVFDAPQPALVFIIPLMIMGLIAVQLKTRSYCRIQ